ncbi:YihY/virulence factor BrkB family protein [Weizmannia sp. CD-2023]|uniref:YihY/virulence factor BrkB family protein n=1 Tax=Heyndrickxia TaxID=2837504 RepID=UPI0014594E75|nr:MULTISPECIES: YihY/virulence factor BrkB family protein [Heyndrickxia]MED4320105.1 YihY/virulence factor BrkB family protein [Weizmannia sp. CD-2023]NMH82995.1 YihY/virulence factor BrkB family protein [Heyndrickxia coagulans]NWN94638.1 YihY/virulence factor BrkB family protein [Bacillus sp. (in: firmicutes)]
MDKIALQAEKKRSTIAALLENSKRNDITGMAAQLSYFFLLSLFPLLIFLFTLLPYLPIKTDDVLNMVRHFAPSQSFKLIETTLKEVLTNRHGGLLSFGMIATLWSASNGMNAVIKALNRAYKVEELRPPVMQRLMSVMLTLGMIIVFIAVILIPVFGQQLIHYVFSYFGLPNDLKNLINILRWALTPVLLFIVFFLLYFFAPNEKFGCLTVVPGAIFATVGWIVASLALSFYVSHFGNYNATYGSLGGMIIMMLWFYISGIILIFGGELNAVLNDKHKNC